MASNFLSSSKNKTKEQLDAEAQAQQNATQGLQNISDAQATQNNQQDQNLQSNVADNQAAQQVRLSQIELARSGLTKILSRPAGTDASANVDITGLDPQLQNEIKKQNAIQGNKNLVTSAQDAINLPIQARAAQEVAAAKQNIALQRQQQNIAARQQDFINNLSPSDTSQLQQSGFNKNELTAGLTSSAFSLAQGHFARAGTHLVAGIIRAFSDNTDKVAIADKALNLNLDSAQQNIRDVQAGGDIMQGFDNLLRAEDNLNKLENAAQNLKFTDFQKWSDEGVAIQENIIKQRTMLEAINVQFQAAAIANRVAAIKRGQLGT